MAMKSSEYWKKREAENAMKNQISEVQYKKDIEEIYANMMDEINKEINGFYTKYAAKEGITMAEAKKRVSKLDIAAYERKAKKYVETKDFSDRANEEMRIYNLTMKVNRLELLKANIGLEMVSGFDEMQKYFDKKLTDRTLKEFQRQAGILGKSALKNEKYAHAIVNASFKNATYSDRIWMYQGMLKAELEGLLASGLIRGQNPKKLAKEIAEKIEKIRKKLNDKEKKNYKSNAKEDPIAKFESCGIKFRNNSSTELPEEIINKYADFVSDFEAKHASYFNKNKLQLNSISVVDDLKENGKTAAGAYYSKSRSIKLMKKSIESKPTSKLITYSKSDDYKIHFFAHEYGHYIADSLNKNFSVEDYDIVQSSLLRYFDGDIFKAKTSNLVDVLGSYGSKDAREAFAEAFAEAYTCKNPRKFAKIFKEELEKTLKRSSSTGRHQSSIAKGKGNDIINSGAVKGALTDKNDPLYVKRDAHAIKYYESVRRSKKNNMFKTIANNTGI